MSYEGSSSKKIYQFLLDIRGNIISKRENLSPGVYYVKTTWLAERLNLSIKVKDKIKEGLTPDIKVGAFNKDFVYSHTENYQDRYSSESSNYNVKDIVYKVAIKQPMKLTISYESSNLSKTRLALLKLDKNDPVSVIKEIIFDKNNKETEI